MVKQIYLALPILLVAACDSGEAIQLPVCADGQVAAQSFEGWVCTNLSDARLNELGQAVLDCADQEVAVYSEGAWRCGAPESSAGGDITEVNTFAGSGLVGGSKSGVVSLEVRFAEDGTMNAAARGDHGHAFSELRNLPSDFADQRDDDALGVLSCLDDQVAAFDISLEEWVCRTLTRSEGGAEVDPTVNDLAKSNVLDACGPGDVPRYEIAGWVCGPGGDTLGAIGSCAEGQTVVYSATNGWVCGSVAGGGGIASVVAGSGLTGGGGAGNVTLEADFGGTCTSGKVACAEHEHPAGSQSLAAVMQVGNSAGNERIRDLAPPIVSSDAATKGYVDAMGAGGGRSTVALCCGASCGATLQGWNCDDVNATGSITVALSDQRGFIRVPNSGNPTLLRPSGTAQVLNSCTSAWHVCSRGDVRQVIASCGEFVSSAAPSPWNCRAAPRSYFLAADASGFLFFDGTDAANEVLTPSGASYGPPAIIDCSGAPPLPTTNVRTAVCWQ